jgi:integrase
MLVGALKEPCRTLVALAALTGLRIGELLGLEWKHIDFLREELSVEQALKEGGKIGKLKTESSKARIPLSPEACQFFEQYRMSCRDPKLDSLVFQTGKGTPLNPSNLRNRDLGPMCQKLGLPHFTWHCFRHTAGTLLTDEAESMKTVQSLLRHSDIGQTSRYAHPVLSSQRRAVRKLGSRLQLFPTVPKSKEPGSEGKELTN